MEGEWRETTLNQLGRIVTGKTPQSRHPEYFGSEIPFVTPTDLDGRRRIETTERCLTEKGAVAVRGARIPRETVMVSCIGSDMGKSAIAGKACVTNQQINSVVVESPNCPLFVYYNFSMRKEEIRAAAGGSAQPILNKSAFGQLNILLPTPRKQRAIAHILGTLDDRMNETLEAMARALFKSWFVDFDPVRAKMEGRDPGLPQHFADLFPKRLVDSELGEIPEGWEVRRLRDVVDVVGGTTPSTKVAEYWKRGTHCWVTPKELSSLSSPVLLDTERKITDAGLDKIGSGLLSTGTLLLSSRAPIGYLAISEEPVAVNQGFIAMPPGDEVSNLFLLHWCRAFQDEISNHANGSTFLEISKANFRRIPLVVPAEAVMTAFDRFARTPHERIVQNERESRALAVQRDALLPKLALGEVRVGEVNILAG